MAAVSSLWLRDTYWPRCSRPRAHYGLRWRTTTHWDLIAKIPPKIRLKKFVKLFDHTHVCSSLTNFEYEVNEMTGKGNYVNLLKFARKISGIIIGGF